MRTLNYKFFFFIFLLIPPWATAESQFSGTCKFNQDPKAGQIENYSGEVQPIPVGSPCTDGQRSFGVAVPDNSASNGNGDSRTVSGSFLAIKLNLHSNKYCYVNFIVSI